MKRLDHDTIFVEGDCFTMKECKELKEKHLKNYFILIDKTREKYDGYVNNLLDKNIHKTVKKLYKSNDSSIPDLRCEHPDSGTTVHASTDLEKTKFFSTVFLTNTSIPNTFPTDHDFQRSTSDFLRPFLGDYFIERGKISTQRDFGNEIISEELFSNVIVISKQADTNHGVIDPCNSYFSVVEISLTRRDLKKGIGSPECNNDYIRSEQTSPEVGNTK